MTFAIELRSEQSRQILARACDARQAVRLLSKMHAGSSPIDSRLIDCDEHGLILETPTIHEEESKSLLNIYCQIELEFDDGQYFFDTHILAARQREGTVCLTLAWPETILVRQRRRTSRLDLAQSSDVQLSHRHGEHVETVRGTLYNLSEDGLAFKLTKADAEQIQLGQVWCACFEVPEQDHCYKLEGTICRTLPSSSQDDVIVGMQFDANAADQHEIDNLREFLNTRRHSRAAVGGTR